MDYRKFNNGTPLDDLGDFVIVNSHVHTEFDAFKEKEIEKNICYLKANNLLQMFLKAHPEIQRTAPTESRYNNMYLKLQPVQVDILCKWVNTQRQEIQTDSKDASKCSLLMYTDSLLFYVIEEALGKTSVLYRFEFWEAAAGPE